MQVCKNQKWNIFLFGFLSVNSWIFPPNCEKDRQNGSWNFLKSCLCLGQVETKTNTTKTNKNKYKRLTTLQCKLHNTLKINRSNIRLLLFWSANSLFLAVPLHSSNPVIEEFWARLGYAKQKLYVHSTQIHTSQTNNSTSHKLSLSTP